MDLFTYLMAKKGHNTHRDLFSYLLGKNAGGSGTYTTFAGTSLNISNTLQAKIKNIALEGNTSQDGTPTPDTPIPIKVVTGEQNITIQSKNLLDTSESNTTLYAYFNSTNGNVVNDGTKTNCIFNEYIKVEPNTSYTMSSDKITSSSIYTYVEYDKDKNFLNYYSTGSMSKKELTFITGSNTAYIRIRYKWSTGVTITNEIIENNKIQLENGSTVSNYVEHQEQTYPLSLGNIELCKIGTYQDYIRKSTGKNLLSSELETGGINTETGQNSSAGRTRTKDYIDIQPNTEYTLSADYQGWYVVYYYNESQTFISSLANNSNKITFTTPSNAKYLRCVVAITNAQNVMLNTGQTALPYEPYGTSWYLNKQIDKVVLDGSENWNDDSGTLGTSYRHNISVSNLGIATPILPQQPNLSDYFKYRYSNNGDFGNFYLDNYWLVFTDKNQVYTLANFKTWLSTHNTSVYYVLATPTYTKITDTTLIQQLENINNNARSYKDTTIIECTSASTDNETIGFSGEIKVTSVGNSLNTSLLSSNLQEETNTNDIQEEPNLDEIENDEPIENEVS